ncbi:MAG: DUF721 domain-containing protein [Bacteroidetes bacterium]|nr:MAG: DUF721 domain-containing protein [Bacteroidota bacterium]
MAGHNDKILKDVLREMLDQYKYKGKLYQANIRQFWRENMGTSINTYTKEIKLRGRKVYITIESAALRQELSYGREKLKNVFNRILGEPYIEEVIIR